MKVKIYFCQVDNDIVDLERGVDTLSSTDFFHLFLPSTAYSHFKKWNLDIFYTHFFLSFYFWPEFSGRNIYDIIKTDPLCTVTVLLPVWGPVWRTLAMSLVVILTILEDEPELIPKNVNLPEEKVTSQGLHH